MAWSFSLEAIFVLFRFRDTLVPIIGDSFVYRWRQYLKLILLNFDLYAQFYFDI